MIRKIFPRTVISGGDNNIVNIYVFVYFKFQKAVTDAGIFKMQGLFYGAVYAYRLKRKEKKLLFT